MSQESQPESFNFEAALQELEQVVEEMERGELSLEQSLAHFERGVALTRACQQALTQAEQKVEILMEKNGQLAAEQFQLPASDD